MAGFISVALGLAVQIPGETSVLTCERAPERGAACTLEWRILFGLVPVWRTSFEGLVGARSNELVGRGRHGNTYNYQVFLVTAEGERRLSGNEEPVAEMAERIQAWTSGDETRLEVSPSAGTWARRVAWGGVAIFAFGLLYWVWVPNRLLQLARGEEPPAG